LFGSALVWFLIAFNVARFFRSTLPDIVEARRQLAGPLGYVVRGVLGISIARELVEMELVILAVCLLLGLSVRFGVSSTFHLVAPWQELLANGR
jgi:small-conductance mechanosensitive channel